MSDWFEDENLSPPEIVKAFGTAIRSELAVWGVKGPMSVYWAAMVVSAGAALYCLFRPVTVLALAILAVPPIADTFRDRPEGKGRVIWVLVTILSIIGVYRGYRRDEKKQNDAQNTVATKFEHLESDISDLLTQSRQQFDASLSLYQQMLDEEGILERSSNQIRTQVMTFATVAQLKEEVVRVSGAILQIIDDRERSSQSPRRRVPEDDPGREVAIRKYDGETVVLLAPYVDKIVPLCQTLETEHHLVCKKLRLQMTDRVSKAKAQAQELQDLAEHL
jgi:hypothetical protein